MVQIITICFVLFTILLNKYSDKKRFLFAETFMINYFIMGVTRYISIPVPMTVVMEGLWLILLIYVIINEEDFKGKEKIPTGLIFLQAIWSFYVMMQMFNTTCGLGIDLGAWYVDAHGFGIDPFIVIIIWAYIVCDKSDIKKIFSLWGALILIMTIKTAWQVNVGFDEGEKAWLAGGGAVTHILRAGTLIRYWSLFTDAANMGSHMAMCAVLFGILWLNQEKKFSKFSIFYITVAAGATYGMFLSGARSAMFVGIGAGLAYTILSKRIKIFSYCVVIMFVGLMILLFTPYGNGIQAVRRMRTAFDPNDASVEVRDQNQAAIKGYMQEAPFGIGFGRNPSNVPMYNRFWIVAVTPPDSSVIYIWMRGGIFGLIIFLVVKILIIISCSIITLTKIKDKDLQLYAALCTSASAAWLFAGYANNIYGQYPNLFIITGLETIVFICPFLDKKIEEKKELEEPEEIVEDEA